MSTPRDGVLLSVDQAKRYLQVDEDGDDWDELIADLIEEAEASFEGYTGNRLVAEDETMYFDGEVHAIVLPYWPIKASSVTVTDTQGTVSATDDEAFDTDYYRIEEDLGILYRTTSIGSRKFWGAGKERWKIEWTGGLNQHREWERIKLELRGSVRDWVANVFLNMNPSAEGESDGGGISQQVKVTQIPPRVLAVWDRYRRVY